MSNEILTLRNTYAISLKKIWNQRFPRISKMLPLAIFYSTSQIEISRKFIGSGHSDRRAWRANKIHKLNAGATMTEEHGAPRKLGWKKKTRSSRTIVGSETAN